MAQKTSDPHSSLHYFSSSLPPRTILERASYFHSFTINHIISFPSTPFHTVLHYTFSWYFSCICKTSQHRYIKSEPKRETYKRALKASFYYWATKVNILHLFVVFCLKCCSFIISSWILSPLHIFFPLIFSCLVFLAKKVNFFKIFMSGLYNQISSPAPVRANSPSINVRGNFDVER